MLKVLACVVVVATLFGIAISPLFKINNTGLNEQSCITQDKLESYQVSNQNILIFKASGFEQKLKADFSCTENVKVKKVLPKSLQIEVQTSEPIAKIDGSELAVTRNGQILSKSPGNLPTILLPSEVKSNLEKNNQKITEPAVLFALNVVALLQKSDFSAQNIRFVENTDVAVYNTNGTIALFSSQKEANTQVDSLQALLAKAKIDPLKIAKIDLRFDKPTIVNK